MNGFERTLYAVAAWFAKEMARHRSGQASKWSERAECWGKKAAGATAPANGGNS